MYSWPDTDNYNDTFDFENKTNCCNKYYSEVESSSPELTNYYLIQLVQDGVQGTGALELSYLFYGYYPRHVLELEAAPGWKYNLPLAYLVVVVATLALSLVWMVRDAARGLRKSLRSSEGQFYQVCAWLCSRQSYSTFKFLFIFLCMHSLIFSVLNVDWH